jgi:putative hydrolase of the HAD superfamily
MPAEGTGGPYTGLLVDYAGVLTVPIDVAISALCADEGIDPQSFAEAVRSAYAEGAAPSEVHALEVGALPLAEFEPRFAARLRTVTGAPARAEGLLRRAFARLPDDPVMTAAVADLRAGGVRVAMLSNTWGGAERFSPQVLAERFDAVVLSGEVGLRKPQPEIFALAAQRLGVAPHACVFVDDMAVNVAAARRAAMHGVLHASTDETLAILGELFGVALTST